MINSSEVHFKEDFMLRKICGLNVVMPMGANVKDFGDALNLNDTATLISLEQAPENSIRCLTKQEAMIVLLNQVMMPMWDNAAMDLLTPLMGQLATEMPFYHLKNLPNREATELTREEITQFHTSSE